MPRKVDHDERRRELIEALWRIVERRGLAAVSYRDVAAEAGVSVRRVQYYFPTKAALLADALELMGERLVAHGLREIAALGPAPAPRELLRAAIAASLPVDNERRTLSTLFFSFWVAALSDSSLRSSRALETPRWTMEFAAEAIRQANPSVDAELEATILMTSFTGLSLTVLAGLQTAKEALAAIDHQLDRLFPR